MIAYFKAMMKHVAPATFDVLFVAIVGMAPLVLGRLASVANKGLEAASYWDFLFNGQLAFYSMSSLATLALLCFRKKLPDNATLWIGFFAFACAMFLVALVGADPSLQKGQAFFGSSALYLYLIVLVIRILADAMKAVGASDALDAGAKIAANMKDQLAERMRSNA